MNDFEHFSSLVYADRLGLIERDEIIQLADQKLLEKDKPEYWLIEFSLEGKSSEFPLGKDDATVRGVLRIAYKKWREDMISDDEFMKALSSIWNIAGIDSEWYAALSWAEDDLSLIRDGILKREDRIEGIHKQLEKLTR
ncbi:MAG: hypothetical protein ACSHX0_05470 [Akkermansiaceae bacterium]